MPDTVTVEKPMAQTAQSTKKSEAKADPAGARTATPRMDGIDAGLGLVTAAMENGTHTQMALFRGTLEAQQAWLAFLSKRMEADRKAGEELAQARDPGTVLSCLQTWMTTCAQDYADNADQFMRLAQSAMTQANAKD